MLAGQYRLDGRGLTAAAGACRSKWTRLLLNAALDGQLASATFRQDRYFGLTVPTSVPGVPPEILDPAGTWADQAAYEAQARKLIAMFAENFAKFEKTVDPEVASAKMGAAA